MSADSGKHERHSNILTQCYMAFARNMNLGMAANFGSQRSNRLGNLAQRQTNPAIDMNNCRSCVK